MQHWCLKFVSFVSYFPDFGERHGVDCQDPSAAVEALCRSWAHVVGKAIHFGGFEIKSIVN